MEFFKSLVSATGKRYTSHDLNELFNAHPMQDINSEAGEVLYICYLQMARAGVAALQYWASIIHTSFMRLD